MVQGFNCSLIQSVSSHITFTLMGIQSMSLLPNKLFNLLLDTDMQQQEAGSRLVLHAGQRQR